MALVADALRGSISPGIYGLTGRLDTSLNEWLSDGEFQFYVEVNDGARFFVDFADDKLLRAIAADSNRLAMSSYETIISILPDPKLSRSTSWLLIKVYYAAFFAAHSLLRMFKKPCFFLEGSLAKKLGATAEIYGMLRTHSIESGTFSSSINFETKQILFRKRNNRGGSHAAVWHELSLLIDELGSDVIARSAPNSRDRQVVLKLDNLKKSLMLSGNGFSWLTDTRNLVNYEFRYGSWYPYKGVSKSAVDGFYSSARLWQTDPMSLDVKIKSQNDLKGFIRCCCFVIGVMREMLSDVNERCVGGRSFVEFGPDSILAHVAA